MAFFELARHVAVVAFGVQSNECQHTQSNFFAVNVGAVTADVAGLFQRSHPTPTGRSR